ncbi:MAG: WG repeat-containing protein [Candidatus Obscuribacterales bacterium]
MISSRRLQIVKPMAFAGLFALALAAPVHAFYRYGVVDEKGKEVIPCQYRKVRFLPNKLLYLSGMSKLIPGRPSYEDKIVDCDGKPVHINTPAGLTLSGLYQVSWPGNDMSRFLEGAVLQVKGPNGFGLVRGTGEVLLEPTFFRMDFTHPNMVRTFARGPACGTALFDLNLTSGSMKWLSPNEGFVFNRKQKEQSFPFGSRSKPTFLNMVRIWSDVYACQTENEPYRALKTDGTPLFDFPAGTTRIVAPDAYSDSFILCQVDLSDGKAKSSKMKRIDYLTLSGNSVLALPAIDATNFSGGVAYVTTLDTAGKQIRYGINCKGERVTANNTNRLYSSARIPIPGRPDRFLKVEEEEERFNRYAWEDPSPTSNFKNRENLFRQFLQEYKLIGMPRSEVEELLGHDRVLSSGSCGNASSRLDIEFADERVYRWRVSGLHSSTPWITSDITPDQLDKIRAENYRQRYSRNRSRKVP